MGPETLPDTPKEVLAYAQGKLRESGSYDYTSHAFDRMNDRQATIPDIKRAIRTATGAEQQPNGTWRITGGKDFDEEDLVPVIDIRSRPGKMVIVTIL